MFPVFHSCCLCLDNVHLTSPFMFHLCTPFSCACICFSCNWISPIIVIVLRFSAWKPCFDSWPFELISISHQNLVQHVACPVVHFPFPGVSLLSLSLHCVLIKQCFTTLTSCLSAYYSVAVLFRQLGPVNPLYLFSNFSHMW